MLTTLCENAASMTQWRTHLALCRGRGVCGRGARFYRVVPASLGPWLVNNPLLAQRVNCASEAISARESQARGPGASPLQPTLDQLTDARTHMKSSIEVGLEETERGRVCEDCCRHRRPIRLAVG